jgi:hypothetical protein
MTSRLWSIAANLRDLIATSYCGYALLTLRWPYALLATVTLAYVVMFRRTKWTVKDRERVIACHADTIRKIQEREAWLRDRLAAALAKKKRRGA